jgi:hypothetical protein
MIYLEVITAESETRNLPSRRVRFGTFLIHSTEAEHYLYKSDSPEIALSCFAQAMIERGEDGCVFPSEFVDDDPITGDALRITTRSREQITIPLGYFKTPTGWHKDLFVIERANVSQGREVLQNRKNFSDLILAAHTYRAEVEAEAPKSPKG